MGLFHKKPKPKNQIPDLSRSFQETIIFATKTGEIGDLDCAEPIEKLKQAKEAFQGVDLSPACASLIIALNQNVQKQLNPWDLPAALSALLETLELVLSHGQAFEEKGVVEKLMDYYLTTFQMYQCQDGIGRLKQKGRSIIAFAKEGKIDQQQALEKTQALKSQVVALETRLKAVTEKRALLFQLFQNEIGGFA
ncbi:MAG: hypothetical protein IJU64_01780 [Bacilli bacterium]|nr:hypothetical protein [Bacilli bacterium]